MDDPEAKLVIWTEMEDGSWHGRLSPGNRRAFRKVLGIT